MKGKFLHIISEKPFFLFLLPVFFVWHGYVEFYDLISLPKVFLLIVYYLIATLVIFLLCRIFLKSFRKAALFCFLIICLYFFFGSLQDLLQKEFPGSSVNKYSFILPALLLIFVLSFIIIKRNKGRLTKVFSYLNAVLLVLILFDLGLFFKKTFSNNSVLTIHKPLELDPCNKCAKPDIYLILTDGYSGKIALQKFFGYDNSVFENELKKRKFFIVDSSSSNYNYTLFSIGSMFNMDYLKLSTPFNRKKDLLAGFNAIKKNRLIKFLKAEHYDIYNYSIFNIEKYPSFVKNELLDLEKKLIVDQTLLYRLKKDIGYHLITNFHLNFLIPKKKTTLLDDNLKLDSFTRRVTSTKSIIPKLVYTHLIMPHTPYYFDSVGTRIPQHQLTVQFEQNKDAYISYLKYCNKWLLNLIDQIQLNSSDQAIIILMSDHGFRETNDAYYLKNLQTFNLNAIFFPNQNYNGFYNGMSNVNQFRVILNSQFGQHLQLLKDSVSVVKY